MKKGGNRYSKLLENIFTRNHKSGMDKVPFQREELEKAAKRLRIKLPKNIGDVIYSFRYRANLPESIQKSAPEGREWVIRSIGKAKYEFWELTPRCYNALGGRDYRNWTWRLHRWMAGEASRKSRFCRAISDSYAPNRHCRNAFSGVDGGRASALPFFMLDWACRSAKLTYQYTRLTELDHPLESSI